MSQNSAILDEVSHLVSDFDGVMTDNRVLVNEDGEESVYVSRADGQGINLLRECGIKTVILSSEKNPVVRQRAKKLGIECIQGVPDKARALKKYCFDTGIGLSNILYIGNDVNDLEAMKLAGVRAAPKDAYSVVKETADIVTEAKGGYGVIREIAELFLEHGRS